MRIFRRNNMRRPFWILAFATPLMISSPTLGASAKSVIESFGVAGTWSNDCAIAARAGTREVVRLTFATPFFGAATMTLAQFGKNGEIQFTWRIESATQVTEDKLTMVAVIADQKARAPDGKEAKIEIFDSKPLEVAPLIKIGNKLQTRLPQSAGPITLEKCLQ